MKGLLQLYTGDGKGKTTAAFGLAMRAAGRGLKVAVVQFLKSHTTGEVIAAQNIPNIEVLRINTSPKFTWTMNASELDDLVNETKQGFETVKKMSQSGNYDIIIMDEFIHCIVKEYLSQEEILEFLASRPESLEIVMTGRNAPDWLIEAADLCTEMRCIKHPFQKGIPAREGIED